MNSKFRDKKVAIIGLGMEGKDAVKFLIRQGAEINIFDRKKIEDLNFADFSGVKGNVNFFCGKNYDLTKLIDHEIVVRSPGVYRYLDEIVEAEKRGVEITSPIKIFFDLCPCKIIGVTGTKGKGTTTSLIYEILKASGKKAFLAGNIGVPYLEILPKLSEKSLVVLELSSFQLIDVKKSPNIAVILNITVDHLDWHRDKKEYVEAKKNIVKFQDKDDFAVINKDYSAPKKFAKETRAKVVFFSKKTLNDRIKDGLLLRGEHNLENIAASISVAKIFGINDTEITKVLSNFKGLEHRLEFVRKVKGISFYNDSFATGPQPTIAAIKAFSEPITLILGGYDKGLNYKALAEIITMRKNLKTVILIGDLSGKINNELKKTSFHGEITRLGKSTMRVIVQKAYHETPKGGVVLLSPAAASFDMFKDYKDRGNQFKEAVKNLT